MTANEDRPATLTAAQRAFERCETTLRERGAVGEIGVGYDPDRPTAVRWWARCTVAHTPTSLTPVLVEGYPSGFDALGALIDRLGP